MFDAGHFIEALGAALGPLSVLYAPTENIKKALLKQLKEKEESALKIANEQNKS